MIKRFAPIFLVGAILAWVFLSLAAMPALAVPPDREEFPLNQSYPVADCGDFQVINYEESTLRLTFFYDEEGELIRVNQFWSGTDTLTNSETGASITSGFSNHAVIDVRTLVVRQSGVFWHATVPHAGQVYFETGQYVIVNYDQPDPEITFKGVSNLDEDLICSLLD